MLRIDASTGKAGYDPMQRIGVVAVSGPLLWDDPGFVSRIFGALRITVLDVTTRFDPGMADEDEGKLERPVPYRFEYTVCSPFLPKAHGPGSPVLHFEIDISQENPVLHERPDGRPGNITYDLYVQFRDINSSRTLMKRWSKDD